MRQEDTMSLMALAAASDPQLQNRLMQQATAMDRMRESARALNREMGQTVEAVDRLSMFAAYGFIEHYSRMFRNWAASITETSAALEQLHVRYTHFSSATEASRSIVGLRQAAIRTPFEYMPVMQTAGRFLGLWAGRPQMLQSGSINEAVLASAQLAAATGVQPEQAALTLARMRLPGQRWQRLEAGRILRTQMGSAGIMNESSGESLYQSALGVIERNYGGLMKDLSNTFAGVVSNLKDAFTDIKAGIGGEIVPGVSATTLLAGGATAVRGAAGLGGGLLSTPIGQVAALMAGVGSAALTAAAGLMSVKLALSQISSVAGRTPGMQESMYRNTYTGLGVFGVGLPMFLAGSAAGRAGGQWLSERLGADDDAQMAYQAYGALAGGIGMSFAAAPAARFLGQRLLTPARQRAFDVMRGRHLNMVQAHHAATLEHTAAIRAGMWSTVGPEQVTGLEAALASARNDVPIRTVQRMLKSGNYEGAVAQALKLGGTSAEREAIRAAALGIQNTALATALASSPRTAALEADWQTAEAYGKSLPETAEGVPPTEVAKSWWAQRVDAARRGWRRGWKGRGAQALPASYLPSQLPDTAVPPPPGVPGSTAMASAARRGGTMWDSSVGHGYAPRARVEYADRPPSPLGDLNRAQRAAAGIPSEVWEYDLNEGWRQIARDASDAVPDPRWETIKWKLGDAFVPPRPAAGPPPLGPPIATEPFPLPPGAPPTAWQAAGGAARATGGAFAYAGRTVGSAVGGTVAGIGRGVVAGGRAVGSAVAGVGGAVVGFLGPFGTAVLLATAALEGFQYAAQRAQNAEAKAAEVGGRSQQRLARALVDATGEGAKDLTLDISGMRNTYGGLQMSLFAALGSASPETQQQYQKYMQYMEEEGIKRKDAEVALGKEMDAYRRARAKRRLEMETSTSEGVFVDEVMDAFGTFTGIYGMEQYGAGGLLSRRATQGGLLPPSVERSGVFSITRRAPGEYTEFYTPGTVGEGISAQIASNRMNMEHLKRQEADARRKVTNYLDATMSGKDVSTEQGRQLEAAKKALSSKGYGIEDLLSGNLDYNRFSSEELADLNTARLALLGDDTLAGYAKTLGSAMEASAQATKTDAKLRMQEVQQTYIVPKERKRALFEATQTASSMGGIASGAFAAKRGTMLSENIQALRLSRNLMLQQGLTETDSEEIHRIDMQIAQLEREKALVPFEQAGAVAGLGQAKLAGIEAQRPFAEGNLSGYFSAWSDEASAVVDALRAQADAIAGIDEIKAEQLRVDADKVEMAVQSVGIEQAAATAGISGAYAGFLGAMPYLSGATVGQAMLGGAGDLQKLAAEQFAMHQYSAGWGTMQNWSGMYFGGRQRMLAQSQMENTYRNVLTTSAMGIGEWDTLKKAAADTATEEANASLAYQEAYENMMYVSRMTQTPPNEASLAMPLEVLADARRRKTTAAQALSAYEKSIAPALPYARVMTDIAGRGAGLSAREQARGRLFARSRGVIAGGELAPSSTYYGAARKMLDLKEEGAREQYASDRVRLETELNSIQEKRIELYERELSDMQLINSEASEWLATNASIYNSLASTYGWTPAQMRGVLSLSTRAAQAGLQNVLSNQETMNDPIAVAKAQGAVQQAMAQEFMSRSRGEPQYGAELAGAGLAAERAWMGATPAGNRRLELGWGAWSPAMRQAATMQYGFLQQGAANAQARGQAGAMDYFNIQRQMADLVSSTHPTRDPLDQLLGQYLNAGQDQFRGVAAEMMRAGIQVTGVRKAEFEITLKLESDSLLAYLRGASMGEAVTSQLVELLNNAQ